MEGMEEKNFKMKEMKTLLKDAMKKKRKREERQVWLTNLNNSKMIFVY